MAAMHLPCMDTILTSELSETGIQCEGKHNIKRFIAPAEKPHTSRHSKNTLVNYRLHNNPDFGETFHMTWLRLYMATILQQISHALLVAHYSAKDSWARCQALVVIIQNDCFAITLESGWKLYLILIFTVSLECVENTYSAPCTNAIMPLRILKFLLCIIFYRQHIWRLCEKK